MFDGDRIVAIVEVGPVVVRIPYVIELYTIYLIALCQIFDLRRQEIPYFRVDGVEPNEVIRNRLYLAILLNGCPVRVLADDRTELSVGGGKQKLDPREDGNTFVVCLLDQFGESIPAGGGKFRGFFPPGRRVDEVTVVPQGLEEDRVEPGALGHSHEKIDIASQCELRE